MGFTLPQLVLFIGAFALYLVKPSWLMLLWLISEPLLGPFIVLFSGVGDFEEQQMLVWGLWGLYNKLFLLILLVEFFRGHHFSRNIKPLFPSIIILCVYFIFHNIVTHFSPITIFRECLFVFYTILPLMVFLMNPKTWPSIKSVFIVVLLVSFIQLVFIPLNLSGIYAYSGRYIEILNGTTESNMMSGTFTRSNMMADYLAVVYFFVAIDFFMRKSISLNKFCLISLIVIVPLLFAGSKLPIIVTLVNLFLCIFFFYREKLLVVVPTVIAVIGIVWFLSSNSNDEIGTNEGANRIVREISGITNSKTRKSTLDESTFVITSQLLSRYFATSPIVGHGNAYEEDDNAYPIPLMVDLPELKSDATLAFYLVEYGILGLFLFLVFHYRIIKFAAYPIPPKKRKIFVVLVFVFFFLFAITERGLFNRGNFIYLFIYLFGLARFNKENYLSVTKNSLNI